MTLEAARDDLARLAGRRRRDGGRIRLETTGKVAHLTIDNPGARNAITTRMMVDLAEAVLALRTWDGVLVVLSSADPRSFCSGGHVDELTRALDRPDLARGMTTAMGTVLDGLLGLRAVSVAAIDAPALGGGAELCTATDFRVASPEARIHFVQARLGIAPGWGGTRRLVGLVGRRTALRILTSPRPLAPGEAAGLGLVDLRCDGSAAEASLAWLADVLTLPAAAVHAVKRQVIAAGDPEADADAFAAVWGGPAHREALERQRR